jgi:hypothetical protein
MTVPDPTPLPPPLGALSQRTSVALHDALARYSMGTEDAVALRCALRDVAAEAQARDVSAAELLIAFKALWRSLPAVRDTSDPVLRARLLERLVTICIEEYYGRNR